MQSTVLSGVCALALLIPGASARADDRPDRATAVAGLFADYDVPDAPGCAVAAVLSGQPVFKAAYGQAIVEARLPNTTATAFQTASVSKQFTAFAILMLQADGKLSLQDDVRKYVPELHAFPQIITLDHLLHHTSGLRDEWMMMLQGRTQEDRVSRQDILRVLFAQRELNATPGEQYAYANSDYTLLALVVERASGQRFDEFLRQRIFAPLGMSDTYVQDDWRTLRPKTAQPYGRGPQGLERRSAAYSGYGASNVHSTADDMARWMLNLVTPAVGGPGIVTEMTNAVRDPLSVPAVYGRGLEIGWHRGARTLEHGGVAPGASAFMLVLPDQHFGVSVTCNTETNDIRRLAREIADLYVGHALPGDVAPTPVALTEAEMRRFTGVYRETGGAVFDVSTRDGALVLQGEDVLEAIGPNRFRLARFPVSFSFPDAPAGGPVRTLHIHDPDKDRVAVRIEQTSAPDLTPEGMTDYVGRYYSPELSAVLTVETRGDQLWLVGAGLETQVLQPPPLLRQPDAFFTPSSIGGVEFHRDPDGQVRELAITNPRVVALRFRRIDDPTDF